MDRSRLYRGLVGVAVLGLGLLAVRPVHAADEIDNPKYHAWVNFKPGSNSTVTADMDVQGSKIHISMTRTLISIDDKNAVVETKSMVTVMGHDHAAPARQETFPAKTAKNFITQTGEKEVEAMNKTFKCKVYEAKEDPDSVTARGTPNPDSMKATVYASDDVPGGVVKIEAAQKDGKPLTFILTAMESK